MHRIIHIYIYNTIYNVDDIISDVDIVTPDISVLCVAEGSLKSSSWKIWKISAFADLSLRNRKRTKYLCVTMGKSGCSSGN